MTILNRILLSGVTLARTARRVFVIRLDKSTMKIMEQVVANNAYNAARLQMISLGVNSLVALTIASGTSNYVNNTASRRQQVDVKLATQEQGAH